jgi:hypothetical protein
MASGRLAFVFQIGNALGQSHSLQSLISDVFTHQADFTPDQFYFAFEVLHAGNESRHLPVQSLPEWASLTGAIFRGRFKPRDAIE